MPCLIDSDEKNIKVTIFGRNESIGSLTRVGQFLASCWLRKNFNHGTQFERKIRTKTLETAVGTTGPILIAILTYLNPKSWTRKRYVRDDPRQYLYLLYSVFFSCLHFLFCIFWILDLVVAFVLWNLFELPSLCDISSVLCVGTRAPTHHLIPISSQPKHACLLATQSPTNNTRDTNLQPTPSLASVAGDVTIPVTAIDLELSSSYPDVDETIMSRRNSQRRRLPPIVVVTETP